MFDVLLFVSQKIEKQLKYLNSKEWLTYIRVPAYENEILFSQEKWNLSSRYTWQGEFFNEIVSEKSRLEICMYHNSTFIWKHE